MTRLKSNDILNTLNKSELTFKRFTQEGLRFMSELTDTVIFVKPYGFKNTVSSLVIKKV